MSPALLGSIDDAFHDVARDELAGAGFEDWDFRIEYADGGILDGRTVRLIMFRGEGRGIEVHQRRFDVPDQVLSAGEYGALIRLFRDEVRFLCWGAKRRHGLVVGRCGKLRLFKRSAPIAVRKAAA